MMTLLWEIVLPVAILASVALKATPDLGGAASSSMDPKPADKVLIREVAEAWVALYNAGDSAGVANLYTVDGFYASAHILAHGRDQIQKYWARGIAAGGHLDFVRPVEIYAEGDLGYFLGKYQATNAGVTVDGRIVIVAKRRDGRWQIAVHETVVRDQPE
jgi:ketosteroid isomerase-like protein